MPATNEQINNTTAFINFNYHSHEIREILLIAFVPFFSGTYILLLLFLFFICDTIYTSFFDPRHKAAVT